MTMKIICISDTHGTHRLLDNMPHGDILIHAGDITSRGSHREVQSFLEWFSSMPHPHKIFIAGNHDFFFQDYQQSEIEKLLSEYPNVTYLQDSLIIIDGLKIYGTPWQPEFNSWAFNLPKGKALKEKWELIPNDTNILISHGPPFGLGDECIDGYKAGCKHLTDRLKKIKPLYVISGHIHEDYGTILDDNTTYINCSILDRAYKVKNKPVTITINYE